MTDMKHSKEASHNKVKKLEGDIKTLKRKLEDKSHISPKSELYRVTQKVRDTTICNLLLLVDRISLLLPS